jgi:TonB family protein
MVHRGILAVLCSGVVLASAPFGQSQDATSANLPEHSETGEATPTPKVKKKKKERSREVAASASSERSAPVIEQSTIPEERTTAAAPAEKKHRVKRRAAPAVQASSFSAASQVSLSVAQAMAVSAPLPEYPYEAKHANVTGSGVCVMIVDAASGKVTNAVMAQSTGNAILDKVTTETFRRWRFKPGSVSQVRVPISYE